MIEKMKMLLIDNGYSVDFTNSDNECTAVNGSKGHISVELFYINSINIVMSYSKDNSCNTLLECDSKMKEFEKALECK